ncbi:MAG: serine/threonine-protein phosphatase [Gemmatimonadales bacterium]|nr:serine/threonine-protein phosphatase [Gemmatimonadales bacterium]
MTRLPVRVSLHGKTDLGLTRDHNEDTFLVADLSGGNASLHPDVGDHEVGPRGSLFMVADGMGGAAAGELASAMATDIIYHHLSTAWAGDAEVSAARFAFRMKEAVELANQQIYAYAREHPDVRGMGTTVTAAGVFGNELYLTQIGDSRGYLIRNGTAFQLTRDQSLTQRLVDAGELTEEEAELSERRNIILQALGPDPRVKVDLSRQRLRRGDTLMLCSDGLSGVVKREELGPIAAQSGDLATLCSTLIDLANERGGPDNVTVVAVRFDGEGLPEADSADDPGYQVYDLSDEETTEPAPIPEPSAPAVPPPPAAAAAAAPAPAAKRPSDILIVAALVALIALILSALF